MEETATKYEFLASYLLPNGILDWFEFVTAKEVPTEGKSEVLYKTTLHIYLDERDNRTCETSFLTPNGYTEETTIKDFPVRDRKMVLHIRRRRWKDENGRNVILNAYPMTVEGTRYSEEFAAFLKGDIRYDPRYRKVIRALLDD